MMFGLLAKMIDRLQLKESSIFLITELPLWFIRNIRSIFRNAVIVFSFFTVTISTNDASKKFKFTKSQQVFERSVTSEMFLKKTLIKGQFHNKSIENLCTSIRNVLGKDWYDQKGTIRIEYMQSEGVKYILKAQIYLMGIAMSFSYASYLDNQSNQSGAKKNLMVMKGVVGASFEKLILNTVDMPFGLRKNIINFSRQTNLILEKGDRFYALYDSGDLNVLAILSYKGSKKSMAVKFTKNGERYYNQDGVAISSKRIVFQKPVRNARISSKFGYRFHPVLRTYRFHYGVDYAAPIGTPIRSGAPGIVSFIGRNGFYGNCVKIRHGYITTLYGHLQKYGNIKVGQHVDTNTVIAYIGSTGLSTGPHLHYEIIVNGKRVDPLKFYQEVRTQLKGKDLEEFRSYMGRLNKYFA